MIKQYALSIFRTAARAVLVGHLACLPTATCDAVTFELSPLLDEEDFPPPAEGLYTLFEQSGFASAGDTLTTLVSASLEELSGIYAVEPGMSPTLLIDNTTPSPSTGNPFSVLFLPRSTGSRNVLSAVSFDDSEEPVRGIYVDSGPGGSLETIAAPGVVLAGLSDPVARIANYHLGASHIVFGVDLTDGSDERTAIVSKPIDGGTTTTLVDTLTEVPGMPGELFSDVQLGRGRLAGPTTYFRGDFGPVGTVDEGIFSVVAGSSPELIHLEGTPLPGDALGTDYDLGTSFNWDGDDVVFSANGTLGAGLYGVLDGELTLIADTDTPLPHEPGETFSNFTGSALTTGRALSDGRVVFKASGTDGASGMFYFEDGEILPVLLDGDLIDGLPAAIFDITEHGFHDDRFVLDVILEDVVEERPVGLVLQANIFPDALPGDYNRDGVVSAADYVVWRNHEGTDFELPNRDPAASGNVGPGDYDYWVANFGASLPAVGGLHSTAVPEPSASILISLGGLLGLALGRR